MDRYTYFGICDIIFIVFLILKMAGLIDWSWWWVVSPILIPSGIFIFTVIMLFVYGIVHSFIHNSNDNTRSLEANNDEFEYGHNVDYTEKDEDI